MQRPRKKYAQVMFGNCLLGSRHATAPNIGSLPLALFFWFREAVHLPLFRFRASAIERTPKPLPTPEEEFQHAELEKNTFDPMRQFVFQ